MLLINLAISLFSILKVKTLECVSVTMKNVCQDLKLLI